MKNVLPISPIVRMLAVVSLVGFVLLLMHLAAPVLVPVLFAFFLAALALPPYRGLQKRGVKRGLALLIMTVVLLGGGIALALLALISVNRLLGGLELYSDQLTMRVEGLAAMLSQLGIDLSGVSDTAAAAGRTVMESLLKAIANAASSAVVSLMIVVFFLLESERILQILRSDRVQELPFLAQMPQVAHTAAQYFGIRTRLNLFTGAGVIVICLLLGVDYPLLWGIVAFVLSYIPYIGLATAMIPPALLALAESGWLYAALVIIGITALNLTIENVLEPGYTGKKLKLSPTIVFFSFFFWAWLLGPVGALLSMPITVMFLLVFQRDESTQWIAQIIGREAG